MSNEQRICQTRHRFGGTVPAAHDLVRICRTERSQTSLDASNVVYLRIRIARTFMAIAGIHQFATRGFSEELPGPQHSHRSEKNQNKIKVTGVESNARSDLGRRWLHLQQ
jgi:hypothetical protein